MKAILCPSYGPPEILRLEEIPTPTPKDNEILVKVHAVAVTVADSRIRGGRFPSGFGIIARLVFGIRGPRQQVLGNSFSGEVVAVGKNVTLFSVGDSVFGMKGLSSGAYAEFVTIDQNHAVIKKPNTLSHTDAAGLVFGGMTATYFLRDQGHLKDHTQILINGAAGSVGSSALQIAKTRDTEITAICGPKNTQFVESLGADVVMDYTKEDFRKDANRYDLVIDCVGNISLDDLENILKPGGKALLLIAGIPTMLSAAIRTARSQKNIQVLTGTASETKQQLQFLLELYTEKKLKPVVTKIFPFEHIVQAHALADSNHKTGNIVVEVVPQTTL